LALVLLVVACGKGGTSLYTKAATAACLSKIGLHPKPVTPATDFVASSATGGAFSLRLIGNAVTVSFGLTDADANNIEEAYHRFRAQNVGLEDVLRRQSNVIMLWRNHPQDENVATITSCLKG
jgi:hypothetical protein